MMVYFSGRHIKEDMNEIMPTEFIDLLNTNFIDWNRISGIKASVFRNGIM